MSNSYVLLVWLKKEQEITFGAKGKYYCPRGAYAYVGSSRSGNFARVERHNKIATGESDTTHWHIDYLLGNKNSTLVLSYTSTNDYECDISASLIRQGFGIYELGSSDCNCKTHLFYAYNMNTIEKEIQNCFEGDFTTEKFD